MKKPSPLFVYEVLLVIAMFAAGFFLYDKLPAQIPSHWNTAGDVDDYMRKEIAVVLFPLITLGLAALFPTLEKIDPRKANYKLFEKPWISLQAVIVTFFAYIYFVTLYLTFNPEMGAESFITGGIGLMLVLLGLLMRKFKQNYFVGIRTPWTLDNEKVWNKTHRFGGWTFVAGGALMFLNAFISWQTVLVTIFAITLAVLPPVVYSYWLSRG